VHVGDNVMYVYPFPLATPKGKARVYMPGVITDMDKGYVTVRDVTGEVQCVYERYVKVLCCVHKG